MTPNFRGKNTLYFFNGLPRTYFVSSWWIWIPASSSEFWPSNTQKLFFRARIWSLKLSPVHVNVFLSSLKIPLECESGTVVRVPKTHLCIYYEWLAPYRSTARVYPSGTDLVFPNGLIGVVCCMQYHRFSSWPFLLILQLTSGRSEELLVVCSDNPPHAPWLNKYPLDNGRMHSYAFYFDLCAIFLSVHLQE